MGTRHLSPASGSTQTSAPRHRSVLLARHRLSSCSRPQPRELYDLRASSPYCAGHSRQPGPPPGARAAPRDAVRGLRARLRQICPSRANSPAPDLSHGTTHFIYASYQPVRRPAGIIREKLMGLEKDRAPRSCLRLLCLMMRQGNMLRKVGAGRWARAVALLRAAGARVAAGPAACVMAALRVLAVPSPALAAPPSPPPRSPHTLLPALIRRLSHSSLFTKPDHRRARAAAVRSRRRRLRQQLVARARPPACQCRPRLVSSLSPRLCTHLAAPVAAASRRHGQHLQLL